MADLMLSGASQRFNTRCVDVKNLVYVVEERSNPSTDVFVIPAVTAAGCRVVRCRFTDLPAAAELAGATLVFVRYVPPAWAKLTEAVRTSLRGLAFFMDDDVLDVRASAGMPWRYRFKLARLASWRSGWLRRQKAELWVSTPYLMQKYANWRPRLVLPSPTEHPTGMRRVFYHGSASHAAEIVWLRPVLEEALRSEKRLALEIVGGQDVYSLYRGLPRVMVVHPMRWPSYQTFLAMPGRHVGLAPQLDVPFNRARSYTKFFDITRCGAVGIYSPNSACAELVSHETDGIVAPLEQQAWVDAILHLARNEPVCRTLLGNAEIKMADLADRGYTLLSGQ